MRINFTKESHSRSLFYRQNTRGASILFSQKKERTSQTSHSKRVLPSVMMSSQRYGFAQSLSFAKQRMEKMTYGQLNLLEPHVTISYNPHGEDFTITDYYRTPSPDLMNGSCGELTKSLFLHMTEEEPKLFGGFKTILRCGGGDGGRNGVQGFFNAETSNHNFLIVSPKELSDVKQYSLIDESSPLLKQLHDAFVLDPSYNSVCEYKQSGHVIKQINGIAVGNNVNLGGSSETSCKLMPNQIVPIYLTPEAVLFSLYNLGKENGLCLLCSQRNGSGVAFPLHNELYLTRENIKRLLQEEQFTSINDCDDALFASIFRKLNSKIQNSNWNKNYFS